MDDLGVPLFLETSILVGVKNTQPYITIGKLVRELPVQQVDSENSTRQVFAREVKDT